jgi:Tfp pilus assembly protein PilN
LLAVGLLFLGAVGGIFALSQLYNYSTENELARKQVENMESEVARLKNEGAKVQQQLSPQQRELLIASHKLVNNKTFGWSRLFHDLESVLPGSVSASRIVVNNVYRDGDRVKADLEFSVLGRDYRDVMGMIGSMNNSGLFQAELRGQDRQESDRQTYTEYTLRLVYTPAYGFSTSTIDEVAQNPAGGAAQ